MNQSKYREDDAGLLRLDNGEDVLVGSLQHALQRRQVGDDAARVEVLEAVEDDAVAIGDDVLVVVARVDGACGCASLLGGCGTCPGIEKCEERGTHRQQSSCFG